jgi:hypothetical protein
MKTPAIGRIIDGGGGAALFRPLCNLMSSFSFGCWFPEKGTARVRKGTGDTPLPI